MREHTLLRPSVEVSAWRVSSVDACFARAAEEAGPASPPPPAWPLPAPRVSTAFPDPPPTTSHPAHEARAPEPPLPATPAAARLPPSTPAALCPPWLADGPDTACPSCGAPAVMVSIEGLSLPPRTRAALAADGVASLSAAHCALPELKTKGLTHTETAGVGGWTPFGGRATVREERRGEGS